MSITIVLPDTVTMPKAKPCRIRSTMKMFSRLAIIYPAKMTMKTE